jgi:hypothetical protein
MLDYSVTDAGITQDEFRQLFVQCRECHSCLLRRDMVYHDCSKFITMLQEEFLQDKGREAVLPGFEINGVPMERFEAIFSYCASCDKFMTVSASHFHDCLLWKRLESYSSI